MPNCLGCANLTRKTRDCTYFSATIALSELTHDMQCNGYKKKAVAKNV